MPGSRGSALSLRAEPEYLQYTEPDYRKKWAEAGSPGKGKGIIAFKPLEQGLLTDRYLNGIPEDSRIRTDGRFLHEDALTDAKLTVIRQLNDLAAERGETLACMALKWVIKDDAVTGVLIGASQPEQILENLKALEGAPLSAEELKKIDELVQPLLA